MAEKRTRRKTITCPIEWRNYKRYCAKKHNAKFKKEEFNLTFEEFLLVWGDKINKIGIQADSYIFTRIDFDKPWQLDNVEVIQNSNTELSNRRGINRRIYKDDLTHDQYVAWMRMKAQAIFRDEEWDLSWTDFHCKWAPYWHLRGMKASAYCMSRIDPNKPWDNENAVCVSRDEHRRMNPKKKV